MLLLVFVALINGTCIALSRILNGRLSTYKGVFRASFTNHVVGFTVLSLLVLITSSQLELTASDHHVDWWLYMGGAIGAIYVALNSYLMTNLGATTTMTLVISGQMLVGIAIDYTSTANGPLWIRLLGAIIIVTGIFIAAHYQVRHSTNEN